MFLRWSNLKSLHKKAKGTHLADRLAHAAKFQVCFPHVARNLAFLWAPSSHYPRRSSWMIFNIFPSICHHLVATQAKKIPLTFLEKLKRTNGLTEISHHDLKMKMRSTGWKYSTEVIEICQSSSSLKLTSQIMGNVKAP